MKLYVTSRVESIPGAAVKISLGHTYRWEVLQHRALYCELVQVCVQQREDAIRQGRRRGAHDLLLISVCQTAMGWEVEAGKVCGP